jgi:hypothetical protein
MAWWKFGVTELVLNPAPGSIGGDLGGYVEKRIRSALRLNDDTSPLLDLWSSVAVDSDHLER